jgi:hypothetical protein
MKTEGAEMDQLTTRTEVEAGNAKAIEAAFKECKEANAEERAFKIELIRDAWGDEAAAELTTRLVIYGAPRRRLAAEGVVKPAVVKPDEVKKIYTAAQPKVVEEARSQSQSQAQVAQPVAVVVPPGAAVPELELPLAPASAPAILDRSPASISAPAPARLAPGIVGEIAEYFLRSAMYPSDKFAVAVGLGVVGTLISRRLAGPSGPRGTSTHLYQAVIGPTGSGKEHVRTTGKLLMEAAGAASLIGPGRFKSGPGIVKYLEGKPVSLCIMDELGAYFDRLGNPKTTNYERDATEVLRELWGINWSRYDSPQGAHDDTEAILCPALSLLGMSTPREFYKACKSGDVANGFLNRWILVEEKAKPAYRKVSDTALEIDRSLRQGLRRLYKPVSLLDLDQTGKPSFKLAWGPGAEEIYDAVREQTEQETDERRQELSGRTPEKSVRIATIIAAGCFSTTVNRDHMEWARDWALQSDQTLIAGVNEYMEEEKLAFSELCREITKRIRKEGGSKSRRDILRAFQGNARYKRDLKEALDHLVESDQLIEDKQETGGRPSLWYRLAEAKE